MYVIKTIINIDRKLSLPSKYNNTAWMRQVMLTFHVIGIGLISKGIYTVNRMTQTHSPAKLLYNK